MGNVDEIEVASEDYAALLELAERPKPPIRVRPHRRGPGRVQGQGVNIGEAVAARIDAYRSGEPASPPESDRGRITRMNHLEKAYGGPKGASQAVGVSRETWRRWRLTGKDPRTGRPRQRPAPASLAKLTGAAGKLYRATQRDRIIKGLQRARHVWFWGVIKWDGYYNPIEERGVNIAPLMDLSSLYGPWSLGDLPMLGERFEELCSIHYAGETSRPTAIQIEGDTVQVSWT
jgi:hypothetical protein